jgi:hypothetical protein
MSEAGFTVDRRVTLKWLFGAIAASGVPLHGAYAAAAAAPWPEGKAAKVDAPGYGTDPKLLEPVVPWPKTLTPAQLRIAAALCDTILPAEGSYPAPSAVGIQDFIDEWVSAPYPDQAADRAVLLAGFDWVEAEARARHGKGYAALDEAARAAILSDAARAGGRGFLDRMKFLTTGAYYTSEAGIAELGYVGNTALDGDYPGPTSEAFAHLDKVLAGLNLKRK